MAEEATPRICGHMNNSREKDSYSAFTNTFDITFYQLNLISCVNKAGRLELSRCLVEWDHLH
jgi:hypothetical protein